MLVLGSSKHSDSPDAGQDVLCWLRMGRRACTSVCDGIKWRLPPSSECLSAPFKLLTSATMCKAGAAPGTASAELLLRVIAGRAPELVSPLQVLALVEAAIFYMADPVLHTLPALLQPMFDPAHYQALSDQEVRLSQPRPHHSLRCMCL